MRFKDVLKGLRAQAGLTQEQLAERAGIPLPSLRGHEQGQRVPSWASVVKLARALGLSTDAFADCDEVNDGAEEEPAAEKPLARRPKSK
jgi:transcriptional regulator with XRE-family HTH domain